jgi:hypothetical protein
MMVPIALKRLMATFARRPCRPKHVPDSSLQTERVADQMIPAILSVNEASTRLADEPAAEEDR